MPKVDNITIRVTRDSLRTPNSGTAAGHPCKPTLFLPIESKRSSTYIATPVGRTISTESTDTSLSPSSDRLSMRLRSPREYGGLNGTSIGTKHHKAQIMGQRQKSVSWASVSQIKVVGMPETLSEEKQIIRENVENFVKKLRESPKHTDTIYVYQSAPSMDFDDQDEWEAYQPSSSPKLSLVADDSYSAIACESSN